MKRGITILISLLVLVAVGYFTASKWAIRHETITFYDESRGNRPVAVDIAVRRDKELQANAGSIPASLLPITGMIGFSETILTWQNMVTVAMVSVVSAAICYFTTPAP